MKLDRNMKKCFSIGLFLFSLVSHAGTVEIQGSTGNYLNVNSDGSINTSGGGGGVASTVQVYGSTGATVLNSVNVFGSVGATVLNPIQVYGSVGVTVLNPVSSVNVYGSTGSTVLNAVNVYGSVGVAIYLNGSSANISVGTAPYTISVPTNAVGFILEADSTNTDNVRWAVGVNAGSNSGSLLEPGRDSNYVPIASNISVSAITGVQAVSVQWVLK